MGVMVMEMVGKGVPARPGAGAIWPRLRGVPSSLMVAVHPTSCPTCPSFQVAPMAAWSHVGWVTPAASSCPPPLGMGELGGRACPYWWGGTGGAKSCS